MTDQELTVLDNAAVSILSAVLSTKDFWDADSIKTRVSMAYRAAALMVEERKAYLPLRLEAEVVLESHQPAQKAKEAKESTTKTVSKEPPAAKPTVKAEGTKVSVPAKASPAVKPSAAKTVKPAAVKTVTQDFGVVLSSPLATTAR